MTVRTTAPKDTAKGARGPSVQMQWVCVQQPHPETWPYMSQDETAFIQQPGLGMWLWGAHCPFFRCGHGHHVQRPGRTCNDVQGQATCTKRVKGAIHSDTVSAHGGDNHVWVHQRSERWRSGQSSRYQGGELFYWNIFVFYLM